MINVILYQPEKPANVGNIMRTISAINGRLFIIGPLSFEINDHNLQRAGMDYLIGLDYKYYEDYEHFKKEYPNINTYFITRYGKKVYSNVDFKKENNSNIFLMFGRESTGIPKEIMQTNLNNCLRIPMKVDARSLNLSNCVALVSYEVLRQLDFEDLATRDNLKEEDYLEK